MGIEGNVVNAQSSVRLYANNDLGLTLEYPSDWIVNDQANSFEKNFTSQIFFMPEGNPDSNTLISFSILSVGNYTLNEYTIFSNQLLMDSANNDNVSVNNKISSKFGNFDIPMLNLTYVGHDEIGNRLYVQEVSTISNQRLYTATLVSPHETVTTLMPIFKSLLSSIRIS